MGVLSGDLALVTAITQLKANQIDAAGIVNDVADFASIRRAEADISSNLGGISSLVNNAGISRLSRIEDSDAVAQWNDVIDVNLSGAYYVTNAFIDPLKRTRGRIVNVSSVTAFTSGRSGPGYFNMRMVAKSSRKILRPGRGSTGTVR